MNLTRSLLVALGSASAVALAACGAVGKGNLPVSAAIQPTSETEGVASTKSYVCLPKQLNLILTFSDAEKGNYTSAAKWTSSNPAVVKVSNADIAVPDGSGQFYGSGVLLPQSAGTATVSVEYLKFKASINVNVGGIANLRTVPAELNLAPTSVGDLSLVADLDGVTTNLDANATWAFVTANDAVATIVKASGLVTAVAEGGPLTARGSITGCPTTADAPVNVSPLQSLALTQEFAGNPNLVVNTTEILTATGTLKNGKTQDLSLQSSYTTSDVNSLGILSGSLLGYALAVKASATPVSVTASFGSPAVVSPALSLTPIDATLSKITISPMAVNLKPGATTQFSVLGEYTSGATQPVTRHVAFTTSDAAVVSVATSSTGFTNGFAGLAAATSTAATGATATITATNSAATAQPTSAATVTIVAP